MEKSDNNSADVLNTLPNEASQAPKATGLKAVGYGASALAGGMTTRYLINDAAHENLKKYGLFDDMLGDHRANLKSATSKALGGFTQGTPSDLTQEIAKEQAYFYPKFEQRMRDVGVKNVADEWRTIHRNQRFNAAALGMSVTGVCLGASLEISRELEKRFNRTPENQSR